MERRRFAQTMLALPFMANLGLAQESADRKSGPLFWKAGWSSSRVYLLGVASAPDRSWFTPTIEKAFESSSQLWLEVGPGAPGDDMRELVERYGRSPDKTFLEALEPHVRERASAYLKELQIPPDTVKNRRPWLAYYSLAMAFDARRAKETPIENPQVVLTQLARAAGKPIGYEFPSMTSLMSRLAQMSDRAQSQYIEWLLDYFDAHKRGELKAEAEWVAGRPNARSLDRMRTMPDLYRVMQLDRNAAWATRIEDLLQTGKTHFVATGMLHMLGPDGIPEQLRRRKIEIEAA